MNEKELETQSAGRYAWAANRDARMKAIANWSHYSQEQQIEAERVKLGLEMVYSAQGVFLNPRQKFIAIKLDRARVRDRKGLAYLEEEWNKKGYTKISTAQGITYRIPKK